MQSAHAKSTVVKRSTAWNRWTDFAAMQKGVDIYRPSELVCFTYMKTKQYQYKRIKSYVSAVDRVEDERSSMSGIIRSMVLSDVHAGHLAHSWRGTG